MSIERAIKFCKVCYGYSCIVSARAKNTNASGLPETWGPFAEIVYDKDDAEFRTEMTKEALLALEESLNKATREPSGMENDARNGSLEQVRKAMIACMNCDYGKPSIVDVFIMKSQDFK